jgi:curved DNA-binding protein CbpA
MSSSKAGTALAPHVVPLATGAKRALEGATLSPSDWFLLSRLDGRTNIHMLAQMCGMNDADGISSVERLWEGGLVSLPGRLDRDAGPAPQGAQTRPMPVFRASESVRAPEPSAAPVSSVLGADLANRGFPMSFAAFRVGPGELEGGTALTDEQKKVVLYFHHHMRRVTYYTFLGVDPKSNDVALRSAYFALSKQFHPDRWFRKDTGPFKARIEDIFKWLNRANGVLMHTSKRRGYDNLLRKGYLGEWQLEDQERSKGGGASVPLPSRPPAPMNASSRPTPPVSTPSRGLERSLRETTAREMPNRTITERQPELAGGGAAPGSSVERDEAGRRAAQVFKARARHAESSGDWRMAIDQYQRAVELEPSTELRIALIECMLLGQAKISEIERELAAAAGTGVPDTRVIILQAEVAYRKGDVEVAQSMYEQVLSRDPANPVARLGLSRIRGTD